MKKTKMLVSVAAATIALLATYTTAFATVGAYTVKHGETVLLYDSAGVVGSLINSKLGVGNDLLFKEFQADQIAYGINSIYDDSKKFVPFEDAKKAFEDSTTAGQAFDLNKYLKDAKAGETPTYVYERKVKDDKVVNGLNITKEGAQIDLSKENLQDYEDVKVLAGKVMITNGTVKGKLIVDAGKDAEVTVKNVTGDSITGLSGSLKLEGVVAKQLVVEKALTLNVDTASTVTKLVITAPKGAEVVLSGNLGTVELNSAVKLVIAEGTTVQVKVATEEAKDTTIVAGAGSTVTTDKPVASTEGSGTVTTNPGTSTGGSTGGGGGVYTPDYTVVYNAINDILNAGNALDDSIANYIGVTTTNNSNSAAITINDTIKTMLPGQLLADLKARNTSAKSVVDAYSNLATVINNAGVNKTEIENAIAHDINLVAPNAYTYNTGLTIIQNLINLSNIADKSAFVNGFSSITLSQGITIKGYTVTNISVSGTEIYNSQDKTITKGNIKKALGNLDFETAATKTISQLLSGKTVTITLTSGGYTTTYTISFN